MHPLQEKFQIMAPPRPEAGDQWKWGNETREDVPPHDKNNIMPPGMDINQQPRREINSMPLSLAGKTDVTDCLNDKALKEGFTKHDMLGCDDQYTGEHVDLFYGDAGGFVERNNYLDRL